MSTKGKPQSPLRPFHSTFSLGNVPPHAPSADDPSQPASLQALIGRARTALLAGLALNIIFFTGEGVDFCAPWSQLLDDAESREPGNVKMPVFLSCLCPMVCRPREASTSCFEARLGGRADCFNELRLRHRLLALSFSSPFVHLSLMIPSPLNHVSQGKTRRKIHCLVRLRRQNGLVLFVGSSTLNGRRVT